MVNRAVKAVIFDWAGTTVDHGSLAPMGVFVEAFARSASRSRSPKRAVRWASPSARMSQPCSPCPVSPKRGATGGRVPTEADVDAVYEVFVPKNIAVAARFAELIPGAADVAGSYGARPQDRLDHRLHARDHGENRAGRRGAGFCARRHGLHGRCGRGAADAVPVLQGDA